MLIFLDESGDLGFDFENKNCSRFFTITLMTVQDQQCAKKIATAVRKTLDNKVNKKKRSTRPMTELKGWSLKLEEKQYFLSQITPIVGWSLLSITADKKIIAPQIKNSEIKEYLYNHMSLNILEKIKFAQAKSITLIADRCKNKPRIKKFDHYLSSNLNLDIPFYIHHESSERHKVLQAVDLFCHGIAKKYETDDLSWYNLFQSWIKSEIKFDFPVYKIKSPAVAGPYEVRDGAY